MECHLQSSITLLELSTMLPESSIMLLENIYRAGIIYDDLVRAIGVECSITHAMLQMKGFARWTTVI